MTNQCYAVFQSYSLNLYVCEARDLSGLFALNLRVLMLSPNLGHKMADLFYRLI